MKKAKKKYREMIESVQPFEQRTRYISNIILASILDGIYLSLDEKPDIKKMTVFTRESLIPVRSKQVHQAEVSVWQSITSF